MAMPRPSAYQGPALFSYGFRPFFLAGALYGSLVVLLWLPVYFGELSLPTAFSPLAWHAHEMLYGFLPAIITGFLLTAVPNWTGRTPLRGTPLALLAALWLAGRLAVAFSGAVGTVLTAVIDCGFLAFVVIATTREVAAAGNWRNLKVAALVALLLAGNIVFHIEAALTGGMALGERIGVAAVIMLIILIGGRIVPAFTGNWLMQRKLGRGLAASGRLDTAFSAVSIAALGAWTVLGGGPVAAALFAAAALAQAWRLAGWGGWHAAGNVIVLILHIAYAFIPAGFAMLAVAMAMGEPAWLSAGLHIWMAGGTGAMMLAVMTRASLGHTGRPLQAGRGTVVLYAAVIVAAFARALASLIPEMAVFWLYGAALAWLAAFGGFALIYGPMLLRERLR